MKSKNLPPYAPTLIESTRAIGYSLETAVADIIDNSIAAGAGNVDIYFFPLEGAHIAILDDGTGMTEPELENAMQYGSQSPSNVRDAKDLGRFGLGLKTASLSQCRQLTVVSKQGNGIFARRWDIDHVAETGDWSLLILDDEEIDALPQMKKLKQYDTGTLVIWQKLDRLKNGEVNFEQSFGRKMDAVRSHLSLVYHRYLSGEPGLTRIRISINEEKISPADPFLIRKSVQAMDDETIMVNGQKIIVRPYILPHISKMTKAELEALGGKEGLRRQQGFYVYRNKRLLVWGTWFRMLRQGDLSRLARIQVDIPNTLDDLWTLDIKKSSAIPPAEVRKNLELIIERMAEQSKRTWTFRGKKETTDRFVHVWNRMKNQQGGFFYEINREHPLVQKLYAQAPDQCSLINSLLSQIEHGLPLNQLYVDMNNDVQISNDREQSVDEIKSTLRAVMKGHEDLQQQLDLLDAMAAIEPFSQYPNAVESLKEELKNEQ